MVVNLLFLPDVVLTEILKYLPGKSLHVCRQVHSRLNQKIKELIWANKKILLEFEDRLESNWVSQNHSFSSKDYRKDC